MFALQATSLDMINRGTSYHGAFFVRFDASLIIDGVGEVIGRCHPTRLHVGDKFTTYSLANNQSLGSWRVFEVDQMVVS